MGCSDILINCLHNVLDVYIETSVYIYHMYTRPCIQPQGVDKSEEYSDDG